MKPTLTRRYRRKSTAAKSDGAFFKKENQAEQNFFGESTQDSFFQPVISGLPATAIQRKCESCGEEEKKANRMEDKKEEEKVQRQPEKKEEEKVMKMEDKKEEEKLQKKENTASSVSGKGAHNYVSTLSGKGQSLSSHANYFFSSRMGYDFSNVKLHTDKKAAESAKDINAKAYTIGNNIVFNEGQYNTDSAEGKKLMAHELAHIVQQDNNNIKRAPGDKHDLTSATLAGDATLEKCFDNETVVKKPQKGTHVKKLQEGLIQLGIDLPKSGADSEYGTETENAVKKFQEQAQMSKNEWDGIVGRKTIGLMDMSLRDNTISKDDDAAKNDFVLKDTKKQEKDESCKGKDQDEPCPSPHTSLDSSGEKAIKLIDKVISEQLPPVKKNKVD